MYPTFCLVWVLFSLLYDFKAPKLCCKICYHHLFEGGLGMSNIELHQYMPHVSFLDQVYLHLGGNYKFWKEDACENFLSLRNGHSCKEVASCFPQNMCFFYCECQCFSLGLRMVILSEGIIKSVRWMSPARCSRNFAPNGLGCLSWNASMSLSHFTHLACGARCHLCRQKALCCVAGNLARMHSLWWVDGSCWAHLLSQVLYSHFADWLKASWSAWCTKIFFSWN